MQTSEAIFHPRLSASFVLSVLGASPVCSVFSTSLSICVCVRRLVFNFICIFFVLPERIWHLDEWLFRRAGALEPGPQERQFSRVFCPEKPVSSEQVGTVSHLLGQKTQLVAALVAMLSTPLLKTEWTTRQFLSSSG